MMRAALVAVSLVMAGACARTTATGSDGTVPTIALEECKGKLYLEVHNPLILAVDVYEGDRNNKPAAKLIGHAPPGDTRLPVARPLTRLFAIDEKGQGMSNDPKAVTIRYQTVCIT
jgi:hypothetical protein